MITERIDEKSMRVIVQSIEASVLCLVVAPEPMKMPRFCSGMSGCCSAG